MEDYLQVLEQYSDVLNRYSATLNLWHLVSYVLFALGLMFLAKSCGITSYGLAWVPGARLWVLGSVADEYAKRSRGKDTKYRRRLIWALVLYLVSAFALGITIGIGLVIDDPFTYGAQALSDGFILTTIGISVLLVVFLIDYCVLCLKSYYRCYKISMPKLAALFLWVGLFTGLSSVFMFVAGLIVRNKTTQQPELPSADYKPYTPPATEKINEPIAPTEHYEPSSDMTESPIESEEKDAIQKLVDSRIQAKDSDERENGGGKDIIMRTVEDKNKEDDSNGFDDFYRESAEGFFGADDESDK